MTTRVPSLGAATWTERYETLRRYVLEGQQRLVSQPLGLGLWVASGMAGWMRQWTRLLDPPGATSASAVPGPSQSKPAAGSQPLTVLLAQITLQHLETPVAL